MKTGKSVLHAFRRTQSTPVGDLILANVPQRMLYAHCPLSLGSDDCEVSQDLSYFAIKGECALLFMC